MKLFIILAILVFSQASAVMGRVSKDSPPIVQTDEP